MKIIRSVCRRTGINDRITHLYLPVSAIIICFCMCTITRAELADRIETDQVARNWLTQMVTLTGHWAGADSPVIAGTKDIIVNDTVVGHYYEVSSGGYIIVPTLKELAPIKVYSDQARLDWSEPDGPAAMIRERLISRFRIFAEAYGSLETAQSSDDPVFDPVNREKWNIFAAPTEKFDQYLILAEPGQVNELGPLLSTGWHQHAPYNNYCPYGDGGRCLVGCVATAAAQIIWYHSWPPAGQGSHTYYWYGDYSCGSSTPGQDLTADYSDSYAYDLSTDAVAELCYEVGVAFEMSYGVCASGTWLGYAGNAYPQLFLYEEGVEEVYRDMYSADGWFELIKTELNAYRPILYAIHRHAIVCDGWREVAGLKQYHFNYGWANSNTAWYTLDELYCPWEGCDPMLELMEIGIQPATGALKPIDHALTDDTFGDGDGDFENGETVELIYTLANYGTRPVSDIAIELTTDDPSLILTNASQTIPLIDTWDSVNNDANPILIEIPAEYTPRIDSFFLVITWYDGERIDTIIIEQMIGDISILLVDDDNNDNADRFYTSCFHDYRIPYHILTDSTASLDSAQMTAYDIVFWFTGDYRGTPLDAAEIAAVKGYLNAGGNLLFSGQGIAAQLNSDDPVFLNEFLKADYQSTALVPLLTGQSGGRICDITDTIAIIGSGGAGNQTDPDLIQPFGGSLPEFCYYGQTDFGAVSYDGTYRLLFFSFGFEAIINDDSRFTERDTIFTDVLEFFGYQAPAGYPRILDLTVTPGEQMNLIDHTPEIAWDFYDGSSAPQEMFHLQVASSPGWLAADMWEVGPVSGADTGLVYAGTELHDGGLYYIRVRVFNGSLWSDWTETQMRLNSPPPAPTDLYPADHQSAAVAYPELEHANVLDGENDAITYSYEVYEDPMLTLLMTQAEKQPANAGSTSSWTVDAELMDGRAYHWRVRADDGYEPGPWSEAVWFWVNSYNYPPLPFHLIAPEDGSLAASPYPTFSWTASSNYDSGDSIMYTLHYTPDSTFTTSLTVCNLDTTACTLTDSLLHGYVYYWKVKAYDTFDGITYSSSTFTISTMFGVVGDANGDGAINVGDAVYIINYVFKSGPAPDPMKQGDANGDCSVNVGDAVYFLNYVFKNGDPPVEPCCP